MILQEIGDDPLSYMTLQMTADAISVLSMKPIPTCHPAASYAAGGAAQLRSH